MYPTNITDSQWEVIVSFFDVQRKRKYPLRNIVNAIFYLTRSGVQWRMLPKDLPPYGIVNYYFRRWQQSGLWKKLTSSLSEKGDRKRSVNLLPVQESLILNQLKTVNGVCPIKVLTEIRRSTVENGTWLSILQATFQRYLLALQMSMIVDLEKSF